MIVPGPGLIDDGLAALVGRAILAFGAFDQRFYSALIQIQMSLTALDRNLGREKIDYRFTERRRMLRRYLVLATAERSPLVVRLDKLSHHIDELERCRAHLAHGRVYPIDDGVQISDEREWIEYITQSATIFGAARAALKKRHTEISYSRSDLQGIVKRMNDAEIELAAISEDAILALRERRKLRKN